ncbi:probable 28S ribosomal protein S23, mitochondrial [Hylaeus volcanicus]|uniref:probable 28S ribosomal protein S23, mitochondrial n=1 Tax=Hylaeus volcanicus TaxID=313075 RepID=UPI0023B7B2C7|nr:probable 28S ribosomal protein S23, mitochondrial [Hylaeus volcanicus]
MAFSRIDRVGTIYTRISSLIKGGTMEESSIPVWYTLYEAFPPKYEPHYGRPGSQKPVRDIFYPEDLIRAKFHKDFKFLPAMDLKSNKICPTQLFLAKYEHFKKDGFSEQEAYEKAMQTFTTMLADSKLRDTSESSSSNKTKSTT